MENCGELPLASLVHQSELWHRIVAGLRVYRYVPSKSVPWELFALNVKSSLPRSIGISCICNIWRSSGVSVIYLLYLASCGVRAVIRAWVVFRPIIHPTLHTSSCWVKVWGLESYRTAAWGFVCIICYFLCVHFPFLFDLMALRAGGGCTADNLLGTALHSVLNFSH